MRLIDGSFVYVGVVGKKSMTSAKGQKAIQEWMHVNLNLEDFIIQNDI
jgi:hypothetical protein